MHLEELPFLETDDFLLPEGEVNILIENEERFQAVKDSVALFDNRLIVAGKKENVRATVGVLARITNVHNRKTGSFSVTITGFSAVVILWKRKTAKTEAVSSLALLTVKTSFIAVIWKNSTGWYDSETALCPK